MDTDTMSSSRPRPEVTIQQITLALSEHPAVAEVSVVPCQHPDGGRQRVAFVVPRAGAAQTCSLGALEAHVAGKLGPGPWLDKVVLLDALPRSASGKVDCLRLESGEFNATPAPASGPTGRA